jgi:hypothetical protein
MPRQRSPHHVSCAMATCLASLAWSAAAHAYRPFDGTDADVVGPGMMEIELGPVTYIDTPDGYVVEAPVLTINAGISERWEMVIDATRATQRFNPARITTIESAALLKGILREGSLQDADGWSIATEFGVLLPTHNADDDYGGTAAVIGSMQGQRAILHLNAAVARNRDGENEIFGGVIFEGVVAGPVRPVAEVTFEAVDREDSHAVAGLVGAIWESRDTLSFDVALRAIRAASEWSYEGRIGLTWLFAVDRS